MSLIGKRKCRCCKESFIPDYRSVKRQRYCNRPECRKASKARCQRRWVEKNPTYFKGSDNVDRMLEWRRIHPGRQRRKGSGAVLQDDIAVVTAPKNICPCYNGDYLVAAGKAT